MNDSNSEPLARLLATFNAADLGEGDLVAGANSLAAMACVLANVCPDNIVFHDPKARSFSIGTNLLVSGDFSSHLIVNDVLRLLRAYQNNLSAHGDKLVRVAAEDSTKPAMSRKLRDLFVEQKESSAERAFLTLQRNDDDSLISNADRWKRVLYHRPGQSLLSLLEARRFYVTGSTTKELAERLRGAHQGRALLHFGIRHEREFDELANVALPLMEGRLEGVNRSSETISGNLLLTDPSNSLPGHLLKAGDRGRWLSHIVWLADGNAGPDCPELTGNKLPPRLAHVRIRFESALLDLSAHRLDAHSDPMEIKAAGFQKAQYRWQKFLLGMETSCPGIRSAARTLLASLAFGLGQIRKARLDGESQPPQLVLREIEAFARFLVRRMANARSSMLVTAEDTRRQATKMKLLDRLTTGALSTRDLYRRASLPARLCHDLLGDLAADGRVVRSGNEWMLNANPKPNRARNLVIET